MLESTVEGKRQIWTVGPGFLQLCQFLTSGEAIGDINGSQFKTRSSIHVGIA